MPDTDPLAGEELIVVADTDGDRRDARVRLAAGVDRGEVEDRFRGDFETVTTMGWDDERDDLVVVVEERLGALRFGSRTERPPSGELVVAALVERVRSTALGALPRNARCRALQARAAFVRANGDPTWPSLADDDLLDDLDDWLTPMLAGARGRADLERLDLLTVLRTRVGWDRVAHLDRLAPEQLDLPSGRSAPVGYDDGRPLVRARVQEVYGTTTHPMVMDGDHPVVFELTSPADRPVQVTDDLPGFWTGSWAETRKDMAGRYPKHDWPQDPTSASPSGPGGRRRR